MLLDVQDLSVTYGGTAKTKAVRGVSFKLDRGQTLGVAGESGSGKSTMALSLLRLLPATAKITGEVLFDGEDLTKVNWGKLRAVRWDGISVVFQGAMGALNPVRSIGWQIREAITQHDKKISKGDVDKRVYSLLEDVGIRRSRADAYPHELSGGQRQRVMIAMALACRPDLIVADEPTTALDVIVQAQVLRLLKQLVEEAGIGLIMISHDLAVLGQTCDRLAVMYAGRLVEIGNSREMVNNASHPYTRALAGAFPKIGDLSSRLAPTGLPGDPPDPRVELPGCAFAPRCPVVMDRCTQENVELVPTESGGLAACLRVGTAAQVSDAEAPAGEAPASSEHGHAEEQPASSEHADAVTAGETQTAGSETKGGQS